MKPYENILLITDLDGTLVPHGGRVSDENRRAIETFTAGGGCFGIATGRTPEDSVGFVKGLPIQAPSIFYNGAMLYDWQRKTPLCVRPLPSPPEDPACWPRFAAACQQLLPTACIEIYTADGCHIITDPAYDDPRLAKEFFHIVHTALAPLSNPQETPWLKFFVNDTPAQLRRLEAAVHAQHMDALATIFYSEVNYFEFVAKDASKGAMLEELRRLPAGSGKIIIAAGDFLNDNEMLRAADVGVASGNAHAATKAAADLVGCAASDHLMAWILENVIKKRAFLRA